MGASQRMSHQPKSIHGLDLAPISITYVADVSLFFMQVPKLLEWGLFLILLPTCGSCSPNWPTLSGLGGRGCALSCSDSYLPGVGGGWGWGDLGTQGSLLYCRREERGDVVWGGDWEERGNSLQHVKWINTSKKYLKSYTN
jgi:hypothetical protein